ncbi:MAG: gliding motility protein GldN [Bacteroidota bacterium]
MKKFLIFIFPVLLSTIFPANNFAQVLDATPRDGVYDKTAISQVQPIPYPYLREADIVWTKRIWRTVDLREKMNQPFYFPEQPLNQWRSFAQIIWDGLKEGTITAYNSNIDDQFTIPLTFKEIQDKVEKKDSALAPDPENEDRQIWVPKNDFFEPSQVKKFYIKEDYYFDRQRSVFEVRILGICIVRPLTVEGINMGDQKLFWIYFPDCRNLFAQNEMFNLKNGIAGRLTYDDVFMKRMFSSYITKEENVYNRFINEYTTGLDALLEAEKIKNTLQEFESNLWEY